LNSILRALRDFLTVRPADVAVAVVGGIAVSVRAEPRFTRDLDLAVAVENDEDLSHATPGAVRGISKIWSTSQTSPTSASGNEPRPRSSLSISAGSLGDAICGPALPRSVRSQMNELRARAALSWSR
jgi:hypothetical protein